MPNVPEPIIKFLSIDYKVGIEKLSANKGLFLFLNKKNTGALTIIAPIITKIKEGSHLPNKSRNPRTFSGLIMLETDKPTPKIIPLIKEIILDIIVFYPINLTVIIAVIIKVIVAIIDLSDKRLMPQIP